MTKLRKIQGHFSEDPPTLVRQVQEFERTVEEALSDEATSDGVVSAEEVTLDPSFDAGFVSTDVQAGIEEVWDKANEGGGGDVTSVFGRTGAVVSSGNDYSGSQVANTPTAPLVSTNVQAAIDELAVLAGNVGGPVAAVSVSLGVANPQPGSTPIGFSSTDLNTNPPTYTVGADSITINETGTYTANWVMAVANALTNDPLTVNLSLYVNTVRVTRSTYTRFSGDAAQGITPEGTFTLALAAGDVVDLRFEGGSTFALGGIASMRYLQLVKVLSPGTSTVHPACVLRMTSTATADTELFKYSQIEGESYSGAFTYSFGDGGTGRVTILEAGWYEVSPQAALQNSTTTDNLLVSVYVAVNAVLTGRINGYRYTDNANALVVMSSGFAGRLEVGDYLTFVSSNSGSNSFSGTNTLRRIAITRTSA